MAVFCCVPYTWHMCRGGAKLLLCACGPSATGSVSGAAGFLERQPEDPVHLAYMGSGCMRTVWTVTDLATQPPALPAQHKGFGSAVSTLGQAAPRAALCMPLASQFPYGPMPHTALLCTQLSQSARWETPASLGMWCVCVCHCMCSINVVFQGRLPYLSFLWSFWCRHMPVLAATTGMRAGWRWHVSVACQIPVVPQRFF